MARTYGSGAVTEYGYDVFGRTARITDDGPGGSPLAAWRYASPLDGMPRIAGFRKLATAEKTALYQSDGGGRLLREDIDLGGLETATVAPDALGADANAQVAALAAGSTTTRTYPLDGRNNWRSATLNVLDQYTSFAGQSATYDARGALSTYGTSPLFKETYKYDAAGDLVELDAGYSARRFTYDAFGRRVSETAPFKTAPGTTTIAYDGPRRALSQSSGTGLIAFVDGDGLDEHLVEAFASGDRDYYHQDRTGSVYLVSDDSGQPAEWFNLHRLRRAHPQGPLGRHPGPHRHRQPLRLPGPAPRPGQRPG